jgi:hypothetical protein
MVRALQLRFVYSSPIFVPTFRLFTPNAPPYLLATVKFLVKFTIRKCIPKSTEIRLAVYRAVRHNEYPCSAAQLQIAFTLLLLVSIAGFALCSRSSAQASFIYRDEKTRLTGSPTKDTLPIQRPEESGDGCGNPKWG